MTASEGTTVTTSDRSLAIEARGLGRGFGDVRAVDGLDLRVPRGAVYALLGPNGAGKTTVVRMLATLLRPDAGEARVLGFDVAHDGDEVRRRISLTGQFAAVDEDLTARENLTVFARLLGYRRGQARRRAVELLDGFQLDEAADRQVRTFSGGMRRRLDIAASILVRPELLFLDEPTTGLDPASRRAVWDVVRDLVSRGTTVLLTTQYLDEADQLADGVVVLDRGVVVADGSPGQLKAAVGSTSLQVRVTEPDAIPMARQLLSAALGATVDGGRDAAELVATVTDTGRVGRAFDDLAAADIALTSFAVAQPSLDDVFLALTGHGTPVATEQEPA